MKKGMILAVSALLLFCAAGCGEKADPAAENASSVSAENAPANAAVPSYSTLGEALTAAGDSANSTFNEKYYSMTYYDNGQPVRVLAEMTSQKREELDAVDFSAEDREAQIMEILKDQKIIRIEDLSGEIIPQNELDGWKGKKGKELLDAGFTSSGYELLEDRTEFTLDYGAFSYRFVFEEPAEAEDTSTDEEVLADLTVRSAVLEGLSVNSSDFPD